MSKKNKDVKREDNPKVAEEVIDEEDILEITDPDESDDEFDDELDVEQQEPDKPEAVTQFDDENIVRESNDDFKAIDSEKARKFEENDQYDENDDELERPFDPEINPDYEPEEEIEETEGKLTEGKQMTVRQFFAHTSYSREVKRMMYEKFSDEITDTEGEWAIIVKSLMEFLNKKVE